MDDWRHGVRRLALATVLGLLGGCGEDAVEAAPGGGTGLSGGIASSGGSQDGGQDGGDGGDAGRDGGPDASPGRGTCEKLDLVIVVDNSLSMAEEQQGLASLAGDILTALDSTDPPVEYQLGVAHSAWSNPAVYGFVSPALEGAMLRTTAMQAAYMTRADGRIEETLAMMLAAGGEGSDMDRHLQVAKAAAITQAAVGGANQGFVRPDAALGILIITDADDTSVNGGQSAAIATLLEDFDEAKDGREGWGMGIVAGAREPSCQSSLGEATYAEGLVDFADAAGSNVTVDSLCSGNLGPPLGGALTTVLRSCARFFAP